MPRNRLPLDVAKATGIMQKNPGQFKGRQNSKKTRPIGDPYVSMTDEQQAHWHSLVADIPWLTSSHRPILKLICLMLAKIDELPNPPVSLFQAATAALSKLGATPVDETKVYHPENKDGDDDEDEFYGDN